MKNLILSTIIITSLALVSCNDTSEENNPTVPQSVIDNSLNLFDGEVFETGIDEEDGIKLWELKIRDDEGAIVKFYWDIRTEFLVKIEGVDGPFNYEIVPRNNLINYSTAKTVATGAIKNSSLLRWKLKKESAFINNWVYSFEFEDDNKTIKVYLDAENGNVLEID